MNKPFFHIIYRACDVVNAVNKSPRPYNLDKKSLIKICFKSLYDALQYVPHKITILGDKLSNEMIEFFSQYPITVTNGNYGNDESIRQCFKKATDLKDDEWIYFCEDDYLHHPKTFSYISNLIIEKQTVISINKKFFFWQNNIRINDLVIFPSDYPDRYLANDREPFYIFHSSDCHWRQVANITFTILLQAKTVKKNLKIFNKASNKANDGYLSKKLFRKNFFTTKCLCLSPLPGLTSHLHIDTITPLVDWDSTIKKYQ